MPSKSDKYVQGKLNRLQDNDEGYQDILRRLEMEFEVTVGVIGDKASQAHEGSEETVVEIGTKHEFGIDVPKRSFIRDTVDAHQSDIQDLQRIAGKKLLDRRRKRLEKIPEAFGLVVVGMIQERIAAGIPPENSEETIERKGSSTPLIDTGQLRSSITHKVEVKK